MICPKCGYELAEGHLYCEKCGEEMSIVPEFEPEIEKEMSDTLSSLFAEMAEEEMPELEDKVLNKKQPVRKSPEKKKKLQVIGVALGMVFVTALIIFGNIIYSKYSVSYQISKAKEFASQEKYTQAIGYLEKAHELENDNAYILFLMADYYYIQGKYEFTEYVLMEIIDQQGLYTDRDVENAYDKIISVYKEEGNYKAINELLLSCMDENIVTMFSQYMAKPPTFSFVEGNYDEVLPLKLSANTAGKIYYTLDGSMPDEKSEIYTAPIFLETGAYTVSAVFINDFGIKSEVAKSAYQIDLMVPSAPEVSVYSGDYFEPNMIEASAPEGCSIYYTMDSTDPTADSIPYSAAIPMPLGKSVYKFIAISEEGVTSDITIRTYKLTLNTEISTDMAIMNVIHTLMQASILLDEQGSLRGQSGHNVYKFNAVVRIEGIDYYTIYEYYEDAAGFLTKTDRIYGVTIQDGSVSRITYDEAGKIILLPVE